MDTTTAGTRAATRGLRQGVGRKSSRRKRRGLLAVSVAAVMAIAPAARAADPGGQAAVDTGTAWEPTETSEITYEAPPPAPVPQLQNSSRDPLVGPDPAAEVYRVDIDPDPATGQPVSVRVLVYKPRNKVDHEPVETPLPILLLATPYGPYWGNDPDLDHALAYFTPRGYTVAVAEPRGDYGSGGCTTMTANNGRDTAHVINFLAGQSFSTGRIGMLGGSAAGVTQLAVATLDPRDQPAALKAIAPMSAPTGLYDFIHHDGVLDYLKGPVDSTNYYSAWVGTDGSPVAPAVDSSGSTPTVSPGSPLALVQHAGCAAEEQAAVDDPSGAYTDYFERHDLRGGAGKVRVPTLLLRGLDDQEVETTTETGFWDRIPASTPHKLVIGQFEHALPWSHGMFPNWQRADCEVMLGAWFDHWLKDADNDVTSWPAVQVQDTAGQWRVEPNWPTVGGPVGQLALDPGAGTLGENTKPDSAASYFELSDANSSTDPQGPTPGLTFMTPELTGPLRLTGQMEADLWLETTGPDANVVVGLERFLPDGHGGFVKEDYSFDQNAGDSSVIGMRSTRFRDPILDGWFRQRTPKDPPLSDLAGLAHNPFELKIRLFPQDIVVPTGGKLRLTISGAYIRDSGVGSKVHPSSNARVTVISNREHPSVLRFGMPHPQAPLMNVREKTNLDEQGKTPLASTPGRIGDGDGGGLATRLVWGRYPTRDEVIGPVRPPARLRQ